MGGEAVACYASVADESGARSIVEKSIEAFGRVDVVLNNAGIADPDWFEDLTLERIRRLIEVHYLGTVYVTFAAWPHMIASGYGRIVNTCSEAAFGMVPKATPYGAAKGAVIGFTRELALEGQRHGIRVNAVAPRAETRLSAPAVMAKTYDVPASMFEEGSMDRFAPELVSPAAAFLAHESCTFNGEILISGGGQVMRVALLANDGISSDDMTPEFVAENMNQLLDMSRAQEIIVETAMGDDVRAVMEETRG